MLDADCNIAAGGKDVRQERVLGEFDGVAVVENRHRQLDHAGIRLHLFVAPYRDVYRHGAVIARRIVERQRLVADRPFARGEIRNRQQRAKQNQNGNSTLHVVLGAPLGARSYYSRLCGPLSMIYVTATWQEE